MADSSVNFHHAPSSPLAASQHSDTDSQLHPDADTRTRVDIHDSRSTSELLSSSHPPPALTVTSSELQTHSYTRNTSSDFDSRPGLDNSHSHLHPDSTPELGGVAVSSIINDGHSASDSQGDLYIKVPAYNVAVGRTPPPSYSSLVPYGSSSSQAVASSSRTTSPPHHPPPSTLVIPGYARSPASSSSSYGSIPPASANPFSNSIPTSYAYAYSPSPAAFGPTPMNASHPLLAAPHAEEYIEAPGAADRRARWRFAGAVCWAFALWTGLGGLMALEVWGEGGMGDIDWPGRD